MMETSEDLIPSWINNSFLETALRSSEEENLQVTSYEVTLATSAGDNYSSQMFRVKVHFKTRNQLITRSIILKAEPSGCEMAKVINFSTFSTQLSSCKCYDFTLLIVHSRSNLVPIPSTIYTS